MGRRAEGGSRGHLPPRTWRRPLTRAEETTQIGTIYDDARGRDLDRESAGREVLVHALVSPNFLFKLEDASQPGEHKLTAWNSPTRAQLTSCGPPDCLTTSCASTAADGFALVARGVRETKRMSRRSPRQRDGGGILPGNG